MEMNSFEALQRYIDMPSDEEPSDKSGEKRNQLKESGGGMAGAP